MKKFISLAMLCCLLFSGCSTQTISLQSAMEDWKREMPLQDVQKDTPSIVLRLTHSAEKDSMPDQAAEYFRERLETISGGQIQVEIYPDNTLGQLKKAFSFGNGRVDLRLGIAGAPYSNIVMWLPLLANVSLEDVENAYQPGSTLRTLVDENAEEQNARVLAVFPMQYRMLASTVPVNDKNGFSHLKMRVFDVNSANSLFWSTLCSETVPIEIGKVPISLQLGTIDACDNTLANLHEYGIDTKISDITELPFMLYFDSLYIDKNTYDALTAQQQEQVSQAAAYTEQVMQTIFENYEQQLFEDMRKQDIRFHTLSAEQQEMIRAETQPIIYDFYCQTYGKNVIDHFIQAVSSVSEDKAE